MRKIDWLDFEINEKIYKRILILGIIIIVAYLGITFLSLALPRGYKMSENTIIDEQNSVKNGISTIYRGKMRLKLGGWAYKEGQDVKIFKSSFVIKNRENEKMYIIKTEKKEVPQLHSVDGYNCLNCGLEAESIAFGLDDGIYDLYILYQNDGEDLLVFTGHQVEL